MFYRQLRLLEAKKRHCACTSIFARDGFQYELFS
jgi:hypothetical protein